MSESGGPNPLLIVIALLVTAVLLAVTNPGADQHRRAIAAEFSERRPLAGAAGLGALSAQLPTLHSFVLGSYTTEGEEVVSFGMLGMVWVLTPDAD